MSDQNVDKGRRRMLTLATSAVGAVGVGFAVTPFVLSMTPSARARAAGAPVEVDISKLEAGVLLTIEWRGKPVWVVKRTPEMMASIKASEGFVSDPNSEASIQPAYAQNVERAQASHPEISVMVGICTHLGCSPLEKFAVGPASDMGDDWLGGYFCPCHGSKFDIAGRVYKNVPAPTNLDVPPFKFLSDTRILVGVDPEEASA
jgi:ubiquinol-cytochrome c reductase iron-sulfur subunit